jgi:membrane-associated protease RseP (regulator of RpoE activity)
MFAVLDRRETRWQRVGRPALLLGLTALSIFITGGLVLEATPEGGVTWHIEVAQGLCLMAAILAIVGAHEAGHFIACRVHGVLSTLPHFLPLPLPGGFGTLGAVIRIQSPFPDRRALFDIAIAGPLAGFVVSLPVLLLASLEARVISLPPGALGLSLGEPWLLHHVFTFMLGPVASDAVVSIGPFGMAAWFGLFLTALNLLPIGQLDGGHILYALTPKYAGRISRIGWWTCLALAWYGPNWIIWALLLRILGQQHPSTLDDSRPVGRARIALALVAGLIFAVCFIPDPVSFSWREAWRELTR